MQCLSVTIFSFNRKEKEKNRKVVVKKICKCPKPAYLTVSNKNRNGEPTEGQTVEVKS